MKIIKLSVLLILFSFFKTLGQTPSASLQIEGDDSFCQSGFAKLKITFSGTAPFGYTLKATRASAPSSPIYYVINSPIYQNQLTDGYWIDTYNINESTEYELIEIFDGTLPANKWVRGQGYENFTSKAAFKIDIMPTPNAGTNPSALCGYTYQLQAAPQFSTSVTFWDIPSTGALSEINIINPTFTAPTEGVYKLYFNEKNGACINRDEIDVTFLGNPKATLTGGGSICHDGQIPVTLQLEGNGPWNVTIKNQSETQTIENTGVAQANYNFNINATGNQIYKIYSVSDKNGCVAPTSAISGEASAINEAPIVSAGTDKTICGELSATLQGSADKGTGTWSSMPATQIDNPTAASTNTQTNETGFVEYTYSVINNGCESHKKVTYHYAELPQLNILTNETTICEGSTITLQFQLSNDGPWTINFKEGELSKILIANDNLSGIDLNPTTTTNYNFSQVINKNNCSSNPNINWLLTVEPLQPANAGADITLERQYTAEIAGLPAAANVKWEVIEGNATIVSPNANETVVNNLSVGQNVLKYSVKTAVCPETFDLMTISVNKYTTYNGFSPNNDGINDTFVIEGAGDLEENELMVFNGTGKLIYSAKNYNNNWDGKDLKGNTIENGTYYFVFTSKNNAPIKDYVVIKR
jgi:gliding motility-associated-like protein